MHKNMEFKMIIERDNSIDYLDLTITRHIDKVELDIFR